METNINNAINIVTNGRKSGRKKLNKKNTTEEEEAAAAVVATVQSPTVQYTIKLDFYNYSLQFSQPIPNNISFPNNVETFLTNGKYYALKFNIVSSFLITETDILNNTNILAFKYELSIDCGVCYLLLYIVSNIEDPLNLNGRYLNSCPLKPIHINSKLFIPRRLISNILVGNFETRIINCHCGNIFLNNFCINCNYNKFKQSLTFSIDNNKTLIISISDLYVPIKYTCLQCEQCKLCKKYKELYNNLYNKDVNDPNIILIANKLLNKTQLTKFKKNTLVFEKQCAKHRKCPHFASTKEKFNFRQFITNTPENRFTKKQKTKMERINMNLL